MELVHLLVANEDAVVLDVLLLGIGRLSHKVYGLKLLLRVDCNPFVVFELVHQVVKLLASGDVHINRLLFWNHFVCS